MFSSTRQGFKMKNKKKPKKNKPSATPPLVERSRNQRSRNPPPIYDSKHLDFDQWFIWGAIALTFLAFLPALSADFVNWDDNDYVTNNEMIRSFSSFGKFFTTTVQGNYHPLTMISLAVNYAISGESAFSYHLFNVLFHLVNVFLVYRFILALCPGSVFIAFATAILFGIHPMHVESVAWVSERKDVLYSLFFLLGLISYLKYIDRGSKKAFWMTVLCFVLSLLSKPAAIVFPGVLFLLDFFRQRKWSFSLIVEKLPFFLLAVGLLLVTLLEQEAVGAVAEEGMYDFGTRAFFPFYGYMMYIVKLFWPVGLTNFYPFLPLNASLPAAYLLSPLVFVGSVVLCWATWRRYREITFGFGFYFFNLVLVLQFFLIGSAIIAERYTYLPYVGLFFIIGWVIDRIIKLIGFSAYGLILAVSLFLSFLTYQRAGVWKNSETLWDSAIANHPSSKAYVNRAFLYQKAGEYEKAIDLYNKSTKLNVKDKGVYANLGHIYYTQKKDDLALANFNTALNLKPDYEDALAGRGKVYARMGKTDLAQADFAKAKALSPDFDQAFKTRGFRFFREKRYDLAIEELTNYTNLNTDDAEAYAFLGAAYLNLDNGSDREAIQALEPVIQLDSTYIEAYTNLGAAYLNLNQPDRALAFLETGQQLDPANENNLKFLSKAYLMMGDTAKAYSIFELARKQ